MAVEFQNVTQKSHIFQQQQYMMATFCAVCHGILCGIGFQGYQCNSTQFFSSCHSVS